MLIKMLRARPSRTGGAFTLVETLVSLAILAILFLALGSVVRLCSKAQTMNSGKAVKAAAAWSAASRVLADLRVATNILDHSATSVTMMVPDRDGDGMPETICYSWSGTPGDPLMMTYNVNKVVTVATDVRALNFNYLLRTVGQPPQPGPQEGPESLLMAHYGGTGGNIKTYNLTDKNWAAQTFYAGPFPADTVSWRITHIELMFVRLNKSTASVTVSIRPVDPVTFKPTAQIIDSTSVSMAPLVNGIKTWVDVTFANAGDLDPTKTYAIVATAAAPNIGAIVRDDQSTDANSAYMTTGNAGVSWGTPNVTDAFQYYVHGTMTQETVSATPSPETPGVMQ